MLVLWLFQVVFSVCAVGQDAKVIRIVDEQGQQVLSPQCLIRYVEIENGKVGMRSCNWVDAKTNEGFAKIDVQQLKGMESRANGLEMFLTAQGKAPEFLSFRFEDIPAALTLQKAVVVRLEKRGETVAGGPILWFTSDSPWAELEKQESLIPLNKVGLDAWECHLKKGQSYVIGWKSQKGWFSKKLIAYRSEPFSAQEDGQVVLFSPGLPATLEYDLSKFPRYLKFPVQIALFKTMDDGKTHYSPSNELWVDNSRRGIARIPNLAGGIYYLQASNTGQYTEGIYFCDQRDIVIEPGKTCRFEAVVPVVDTTIEPGDITLRGTVLGADKKPLADNKVSLSIYDPNGLPQRDLWYNSIQTNARGEFKFEGIMPNRAVSIWCEKNAGAFISKASTTENAMVTVNLVVGLKKKKILVGEPLQSMNLTWADGKTTSMDSFKGKILVIDIWATWCGPCIRAMPKLNELARTMQSQEVQFIAVSKDSDPEIWRKKLESASWNSLSHAWFDETQNDFEFDLGGIPFCLIVDKAGIIRATGHELDIAAEIRKIQND